MNIFKKIQVLRNPLVCMILIAVHNPLLGEAGGWTCAYPDNDACEEDGISLHLRKIPGSRIKQFKAETTVSASLEAVLTILNDTDATTRWLYQCDKAEEIEVEGYSSKLIYHTNKPCRGKFCISKRDYVFRAEVNVEELNDDCVTFEMDFLPDQIPNVRGYVRVMVADGFYRVCRISESQTHIYWQQHLEPGGLAPSFLVNWLLNQIPTRSLGAFRLLAESDEYRNATLDFANNDNYFRGRVTERPSD